MAEWFKGKKKITGKRKLDSQRKEEGKGELEKTKEKGEETDNEGQSAVGDQTKEGKKSKLRRETEAQLGHIIKDVERELIEEGVFDELDDEEIAEVKTEAFRSLAKTLTNLLEKLDDAERDVDDEKKSPKRRKDKEAEKRLNIWRKLVEGLDDEEQPEKTDGTGRKHLGKMQVKRGEGNTDGVKVRVSTIKTKDGSTDLTEGTSETAKLEKRIAQKLKDAGFDTQGRPVQVKIITNVDLDETGDNFMHTLNEAESEQITNVLYAILSGASVEQTAEQRRQQSMEESYNFGTDDGGPGDKKAAPMKTVVVGGGGP